MDQLGEIYCKFKLGLVYWLDCLVSGVVFFVCFENVLAYFNEQFCEWQVEKVYFVVVVN